jgi:hypothetical protein
MTEAFETGFEVADVPEERTATVAAAVSPDRKFHWSSSFAMLWRWA